MSTETIRELENRILMLRVAEKNGKRVIDSDTKYARGVFELEVKLAEMREAEAKQPQISQTQLDQLAWLDQMSSARDAEGRQLYFDHGARGAALRQSIHQARSRIASGAGLDSAEMERVRQLATESGAVSYPAVHADPAAVQKQRNAIASEGALSLLPPSGYRNAVQTTNSTISGGPAK